MKTTLSFEKRFKNALKLLLTVVLLTLSANYSFAECKVNTEVDLVAYLSGQTNYPFAGPRYIDFEKDGYDQVLVKTTDGNIFEQKVKLTPALRNKRSWGSPFSEDAFWQFVEATELNLIDAVKKVFCPKLLDPEATIKLTVSFLKLEIQSTKTPMDLLKQRLKGVTNNYANIKIGSHKKEIKATIIWNPRRMFRDEMILRGWRFDEQLPLLPFDKRAVESFYPPNVEKDISARYYDDFNEKNLTDREVFTLFKLHGDFSRLFFGVVQLKNDSKEVYTEITKQAINRAFDNVASKPIINILDVNRQKILKLYPDKWHEYIKKYVTNKKVRK